MLCIISRSFLSMFDARLRRGENRSGQRTSDYYQCYMFEHIFLPFLKGAPKNYRENETLEVLRLDKNSLLWLFNLRK